MNVPIDELKEAIEYLEKKKMDRDSTPVYRWLLKDRAVAVSKNSYPPSISVPIKELIFEYNYRYKIWELKHITP